MLAKLPEFIEELGVACPLLVTDEGVMATGHVQRALDALESAGIHTAIYSKAQENPTSSSIEACRDFARQAEVDSIIGFGGGSSMDTAKGCNFLLTNGGEMKDYHGYGKASKPMLPFVAVPTTSGTGSECQSYALVSDDKTHVKMACGDGKALAKIALLDPELTTSQPVRVAVLTGLDALAHALESAVCLPRNPISQIHSRQAFRLLSGSIEKVIEGNPSLEDRSNMQLGAAMAGLAIENSMLGAAHAMANPLTARFDVTHGHAVALMLPQVVGFNQDDPAANTIYEDLQKLIPSNSSEYLDIIDWLDGLVVKANLASLPSFGIENGNIDDLAFDASQQWTGKFNPRPASEEDFKSLYADVLQRMAKSA